MPRHTNRRCSWTVPTPRRAALSAMTFYPLIHAVVAGLLLTSPVLVKAAGLEPVRLKIGSSLQTSATIRLSEPAPKDGLELKLTSEDPARIRLAKRPDVPGTGELTLVVRPGLRESPEYWVQASGDPGESSYTASAPGFGSVDNPVTITHSALVLVGPFRAPRFQTTSRAEPSKLQLYPARLDESMKYAEQQMLAAGISVQVELSSSNPEVGDIPDSPVKVSSVTGAGVGHFHPAAAGATTITASVPPGFSRPADFHSIDVSVRLPGIGLMDQVMIGQNLQVTAAVGLGEPAPRGGVTVKLVSDDPERLIISGHAATVGAREVSITIPEGAVKGSYYLQALGKSGSVTYTATAAGHQTRTATVLLAPSGIVVTPSPYGPPDEAEVVRRESTIAERGFVATLSKHKEMDLVVWTAHLDPSTLRAADVTVQPLRAGMSIRVDLSSADARIGKVVPSATINGGADHAGATFTAVGPGSTLISASTPPGFTTPSNSTSVRAIVRE